MICNKVRTSGAVLWQSNKLSVPEISEDIHDKLNNYQFLNEDPALWKHDITLYICIALPTRQSENRRHFLSSPSPYNSSGAAEYCKRGRGC